jgi:hypothetical protein
MVRARGFNKHTTCKMPTLVSNNDFRSAPENRFHAGDRFHALLDSRGKLQDMAVDTVINDKDFRVLSLRLVMGVVRVEIGVMLHKRSVARR